MEKKQSDNFLGEKKGVHPHAPPSQGRGGQCRKGKEGNLDPCFGKEKKAFFRGRGRLITEGREQRPKKRKKPFQDRKRGIQLALAEDAWPRPYREMQCGGEGGEKNAPPPPKKKSSTAWRGEIAPPSDQKEETEEKRGKRHLFRREKETPPHQSSSRRKEELDIVKKKKKGDLPRPHQKNASPASREKGGKAAPPPSRPRKGGERCC